MAITQDNILIQPNEWLNLTQAAILASIDSVSSGAALNIQNNGCADLNVAVSETQPVENAPNPSFRILKRGDLFITDTGDPDVWAYAGNTVGSVNLQVRRQDIAPSASGFGEQLSASLYPIAQASAQYGITAIVQVDEVSGGTATAENGNFKVDTGTDPFGVAFITSSRLVKYRPGQSLRCRITALFDQGQPNSQQIAGFFTSEDALGFGYSGDQFGIIRASGGNNEVQKLTVVTSGAGVATIVINNAGYDVTLTAGTESHNAYEIASQLNGVVPAFRITANKNVVTAAAIIPGSGGLFATTGSTAVLSWSQIVAGVQPTIYFTSQSDWNIDGVPWLDSSKGNVYEIVFEYLGYGSLEFKIEEPTSGKLITVHRERYANANVVPSFGNPVFRAGWVARNLGNTSSIALKGASVGAFNDGVIHRSGPLFSKSTAVDALGTNEVSLITIRSGWYFNGRLNRIELFPLIISVAAQTAKGAFFDLLINPTIEGEMVFDYVDEANSVTEFSLDNLPVSGGLSVGSITAESGSGRLIEFNIREDLDTVIGPGDIIVIAARVAASPTATAQASITWQEDY